MSYNAIVAHVRHNYTNYEPLLREIECMPGGRDAYEILKDRMDRMIHNALQEQYGLFPMAS